MAFARQRPNIAFIPKYRLGWRELRCHGGALLRAAPAPGIDAHAASALPSWNHGAAARRGVQG